MKLIAALTVGFLVAGCEDAYSASATSDLTSELSNVTLVAGHSILTGANGMTLYTFDKDSKGKSNCYGGCAGSWPPYLAKAGAKAPAAGFALIKRKDGTMQWAKNGAPLYFWAGDAKPGDTTGDGVGGVWHLAK
ncbi:MAG: hypothetical protein AAGA08_07325 [Pseudomonadota bacterium]